MRFIVSTPSITPKVIISFVRKLPPGQMMSFHHVCNSPHKPGCTGTNYLIPKLTKLMPERFYRSMHDKQTSKLWIARLR